MAWIAEVPDILRAHIPTYEPQVTKASQIQREKGISAVVRYSGDRADMDPVETEEFFRKKVDEALRGAYEIESMMVSTENDSWQVRITIAAVE